jgi:glycerol-3-phosphate dehydrogenase
MPGYPVDDQRHKTLQTLATQQDFDLVVVGGGATGLGIALDATLRGLKVALLERGDFGQGTSSRSTKLVHGGVRYLAQGDFRLVHEALHERAHLLANAPHIARPLAFVMPAYRLWQIPFYGAGLKAYDWLSGRAGLGDTRLLGPARVRDMLPTVRTDGLVGGVSYWDGQFDDARLAVTLARTAQHHGAVLANHCPVLQVRRVDQQVTGVDAWDVETGRAFSVKAPCVINATGVWVDQLLKPTQPAAHRALVTPSQGVHLSFDRSLLPGTSALFWPRTRDGRVLFAIPWLGKTIVGTTDTARSDLPPEPEPLAGEVDAILRECADFFDVPPQRSDILSAWVGLRPLVTPPATPSTQDTPSISREHTVLLRPDGLVSVTGGKWTTYRAMAQDVLDQCTDAGLVPRKGACQSASTRLLGAGGAATGSLADAAGLHSYGTEADVVASLPGSGRVIAPGLTEAMVRFAVRFEFARTLEDVLARRNRLLFLDAQAAAASLEAVATVMASETQASPQRAEFQQRVTQYSAASRHGA